jgi:hypothetical protein
MANPRLAIKQTSKANSVPKAFLRLVPLAVERRASRFLRKRVVQGKGLAGIARRSMDSERVGQTAGLRAELGIDAFAEGRA